MGVNGLPSSILVCQYLLPAVLQIQPALPLIPTVLPV
jgi:hypothetical protein